MMGSIPGCWLCAQEELIVAVEGLEDQVNALDLTLSDRVLEEQRLKVVSTPKT